MLYKKYHRNFIRQFKLGTKIIIGYEHGEVIEEPSIDKDNWYMFNYISSRCSSDL